MKKILSVIASCLVLIVIGGFAIKTYNESPELRQTFSYFADGVRELAGQTVSAVTSLLSWKKAADGKNNPAIPVASDITQDIADGGPESEVAEPVSAEDLKSVWGETGMKGLTVYEYGKTLLSDEEKRCYIKIADALRDIEPSVTIKTTLPPEKLKKVYQYYIYDHVEVFYTDGVGLEYTQFGNRYTYNINFSYKYGGDKSKIAEMRAQMGKRALELLKETEGLSTDLKKERKLHDKLIKSCSYDIEAAQSMDSELDSFSAYGALVSGKAVCQGYAQAMKLLLSSAGIKSIYITGQANGGSHAWNIVEIGGQWRYLDVTFDDPVFTDENGNYINHSTVSYTYFNFVDSGTHTPGKFDASDPFSETSENYEKLPKVS